jgi:hypothetical protein
LKVGAIRLPSVFIHHEDQQQSKALLKKHIKPTSSSTSTTSTKSNVSLVTGYSLKDAPLMDQVREFVLM